jgi:hypothetical protein
MGDSVNNINLNLLTLSITMVKILSACLFALSATTAMAQYQMRTIDQLINRKQPGWPVILKWIDSAKNKVEVLPVDTTKAREALYKTQVTTRSVMGAIVFSTGGILVDNGWIRILGSGSSKMKRSLPDWNKGKAFKEFGDRPEFFLVADDAAGGFFAINYGSFGKDLENIYYLSPDNLKWEAMDMTYEEFIWFCFTGDINKFYEGIKWSSWQKDIQSLIADDVFNFYPPLWSKEGKDEKKRGMKPVPAGEQFSFNLSMRKQMGFE